MPAGAWFRSLSTSRLGPSSAFFAATLGLLGLVRVHAPIHLDTARDLLIARDCVLGVSCIGAGPRTSFGVWTQGALWSHVLELRESWGLGLSALEAAANLALALAAALVPVAARSIGRAPNALTWAMWFAGSLLTIGYPILWNPTLLPLALGGFAVVVHHAARARSSAAFVVAAAALATSIDLHVVSALQAPLLLAAIVGCAARPLVAATCAAAIVPLVLALSSPGAFAVNWPLIAARADALVVVLSAAVLVGAAARRRLTALDGATRATLLARATCVYLLGVVPALALLTGHALHMRYLAPLVIPAALLISTHRRVASAWVRGVGVALVVTGFVAFALGERAVDSRFRLVEVERIAAALHGRGASYGDLLRRLRGPDSVHLLAVLAALEPPGSPQRMDDDHDLLVLRTERRELPQEVPPGWIVVDLDERHVGVVVPYRPWVRVEGLDVCRGGAPPCERVELDGAAVEQRPGMRWADRAYPSLLPGRRPSPGERVSVRLSVDPVPGERARWVHLLSDRCAGWEIAAPGEGERGDVRSVRLDADARSIEFAVVSGPGCRWWLPPFVEVTPGDASLHRLVQRAK